MKAAVLQTLLNASASSAGALFSTTTFEVPEFQREYSWGRDEISDFWSDLQSSIGEEAYFLGLIILTNPSEQEQARKHVVDGQQRIITLSLLAAALYHEAVRRDRTALADRIQADFLRSIDYDTDETAPRVALSDEADDATFQQILEFGEIYPNNDDADSVSSRMVASYDFLRGKLQDDLKSDSFKRLGRWTEFLTNRLYFAVFVHPDASAAYQVYEVINTRGKDLTTAHLLKNYLISQTPPNERSARYAAWTEISRQFASEGTNNFVQFIRHVVTVRSGHVLPKDLFGFLAGRIALSGRNPPTPNQLMTQMNECLPLYLQMVDPTLGGPAEPNALRIFQALNSLGVLAVRPILLATASTPNAQEGMEFVLRLVVRRIVVGNLGTGNVERRFGEAARRIHDTGNWQSIVTDLGDLNPSKDDFVEQLRKRSFNKQVLQFLRRSIVQKTITPREIGTMHFIWARKLDFPGMGEEEGAFWASTIGNTFLSSLERRPRAVGDWPSFRTNMLPNAVDGELQDQLGAVHEWNVQTVEQIGAELARIAGDIWYAA